MPCRKGNPTLLCFQLEGFAVSAFVHCGVGFVGSHLYAVQRAVILVLAMIGALLYAALDGRVCFTRFTSHNQFLLKSESLSTEANANRLILSASLV